MIQFVFFYRSRILLTCYELCAALLFFKKRHLAIPLVRRNSLLRQADKNKKTTAHYGGFFVSEGLYQELL